MRIDIKVSLSLHSLKNVEFLAHGVKKVGRKPTPIHRWEHVTILANTKELNIGAVNF